MKINDPERYFESLRKLERNVYMLGEMCANTVDHPVIRPSTNAVAETYNVGNEPEAEELLFTKSHLSGNKISRFTHIHQNTDDLIKNDYRFGALAGKCHGRSSSNTTCGSCNEHRFVPQVLHTPRSH